MSLDKAIAHRKEHRRPYRGSKRFDRTCRNHGSCGYCVGNRTFGSVKALSRPEEPARIHVPNWLHGEEA